MTSVGAAALHGLDRADMQRKVGSVLQRIESITKVCPCVATRVVEAFGSSKKHVEHADQIARFPSVADTHGLPNITLRCGDVRVQ